MVCSLIVVHYFKFYSCLVIMQRLVLLRYHWMKIVGDEVAIRCLKLVSTMHNQL
jgi:hypothetical protein